MTRRRKGERVERIESEMFSAVIVHRKGQPPVVLLQVAPASHEDNRSRPPLRKGQKAS